MFFCFFLLYVMLYLHGCKLLGPRWLLLQLTEGKAGREDEEGERRDWSSRRGEGREGGREERRKERRRA